MWFYVHENKAEGPVSEKILHSLLVSGTLPSDTLVWQEGRAEWVRAYSVFADLYEGDRPPEPEPVPPSVVPPAPWKENPRGSKTKNAAPVWTEEISKSQSAHERKVARVRAVSMTLIGLIFLILWMFYSAS